MIYLLLLVYLHIYISNRTQRVQIENVMADFNTVTCGIPQGSVLGPLKICCMYYLRTFFGVS